MHPYRSSSPSDAADEPREKDAPQLEWVLLATGALPIAWTQSRGDDWGAEPSLGLLLVLFAGRALGAHYLRALRRVLSR